MLKASRFNVLATNEPLGGVLYNTLYGSVTEIEPDEWPAVQAALADPDGASAVISEVLVSQHHLVDATFDELAVVRERKQCGIDDPNRLDVVVMPTLDCNFRCVYCYEDHVRSTMTDAVEVALRRWLDRQVPSAQLTMLHWFGGEPLLCTDRVVSVSKHLAEVAREHGVGHVVHITTNGFLLDGARRAALLAADIVDYQVTIDGTAESHDRLRPLKSGRGTFQRVFGNVCDTLRADPRVQVTLRINFNQSNMGEAASLLSRFEPELRSRLRLVLEPIFGTDEHAAIANVSKPDLSRFLHETYELAAELGYEVSASKSNLLTGKLVYCYAERAQQIVVGHNGNVYKCSVGSFSDEDRLGVLSDDGHVLDEQGRLHAWLGGALWEPACEECSYLPLCMGGCRNTRTTKHTDGGATCALIPTNASYVLKQVALAGYPGSLLELSRHTNLRGGESDESDRETTHGGCCAQGSDAGRHAH